MGSHSSRDVVRLAIPSHPRYLCMVRRVATEAAQHVGFSPDETKHIVLAIDEACSNVIKYSYAGDHTKRIMIALEMADGGLTVRLRDFGRKPDLGQIRSRRLEDVKPGGLGVHFMQTIMDEVEYDVSPRIGTELRMVKRRKCAVEDRGDEGIAGDRSQWKRI
ncbi:MAG: ATP-binding protein [Planctomycetes bacterium]|nr:ATP-binding protein [Planctomycetota bacterium]MBM4087743.1 ATP-binding protein [Planctomycetota bacterium]